MRFAYYALPLSLLSSAAIVIRRSYDPASFPDPVR